VALLPILLLVAPERAGVSAAACALLGALVALARRRSAGDEAEPAATPRTPRSPTPRRPAADGGVSGAAQLTLWEVQQCWNALPAPDVHNTAHDS